MMRRARRVSPSTVETFALNFEPRNFAQQELYRLIEFRVLVFMNEYAVCKWKNWQTNGPQHLSPGYTGDLLPLRRRRCGTIGATRSGEPGIGRPFMR
jgi:hypothetical protein